MTALITWLVPAAGPMRDRLAAAIDRLAEHDAPQFPPHVTVVATLDSAQDATAQILTSLLDDMPPVDLTFDAIGHEATYFRALYLRAAPSAQLLALQQAAQRAWALDPLPYVPHLSLLLLRHRQGPKAPDHRQPLHLLAANGEFDAVELWARDPRGVGSWYRTAQVPLSVGL